MSDDDTISEFALFKLYLLTAEKVSDRRANANTWMLSVNSAITSLYGFLTHGQNFTSEPQANVWLWALPLAGILVCCSWVSLIESYRVLNNAKFQVIEEIEAALPHRLFRSERHHYEKLGRRDLSKIERFIPISFIVLYAIILSVVFLV